MRRTQGFSLLEVMVALAVFATVAAMVHATVQRHLRNARVLEQRVFGNWLADNTLAGLQAGLEPLVPGQRRVQQELAGRAWEVRQTVAATATPGIYRISIATVAGDAAGSGPELIGFVAVRP